MEGFIEVNEISDFISYIRSVSSILTVFLFVSIIKLLIIVHIFLHDNRVVRGRDLRIELF